MTLVTDASVGRVCSCHHARPKITRNSFLLSKNVCWCWLRMPLLAESVPATMLDPKALGTAFQKKKQKVRMELHILTFIEQCSGLQGRRRCLAAGVLDIWHGTDPPGLGTARHGTGRPYLGLCTGSDDAHHLLRLRTTRMPHGVLCSICNFVACQISKTPAARQRRLPCFPLQ